MRVNGASLRNTAKEAYHCAAGVSTVMGRRGERAVISVRHRRVLIERRRDSGAGHTDVLSDLGCARCATMCCERIARRGARPAPPCGTLGDDTAHMRRQEAAGLGSGREQAHGGPGGQVASDGRQVRPAWLTRDMRLVLIARASMSAARGLAGVLTPIYLTVIGFTAVQLGALFTLVALVSAGLSALVGLLADRLGRKPFLIALPVLTAAAGVAFALTRSPAVIVVAAAAGSFGRGAGAGAGTVGPYQPAEQAYLADAVPHRARNDLFGRLAFMSSLGGLIGAGPLAALPDVLPGVAELGVLASYRVAFLVMAGLALAAGLLVVPIAEARQPHQHLPWRPRRLRLSGQSWHTLWRLWLANSLNGLAVGFFGPFITYWFYVRFGAGPAQVGILYAIVNLAAMASNLGAAPFARRLGLVRAIVLSRSLQALLIIPMVLAPSFWLAGAMYLVRMMAQRLGLPLRQSYVMGVVPAEERGAVAALSNLLSQGTSAIGPTLAGYLFANVSLALPFEIGAALQGASTLLFYVFFRTTPPPEERAPDPTKRAPAEAAVSAARTATAGVEGSRDAWLDAGTGRDVC